jgi:hypothetical protein
MIWFIKVYNLKLHSFDLIWSKVIHAFIRRVIHVIMNWIINVCMVGHPLEGDADGGVKSPLPKHPP